MIFKVKWGDIGNEFAKKVMVSNPGRNAPIKLYFETKGTILAFIQQRGVTLYSEINKKEMDVNSFKLEFLSDAFELQENPLIKRGSLTLQY